MTIATFLLGAWFGVVFGFFVAAMCNAAGNADNQGRSK